MKAFTSSFHLFALFCSTLFFWASPCYAGDHEKHSLRKEANGFFHVDEYEEAKELFLQYDKLWPGENEVKFKLGVCYLKLKQYDKGLEYLKQVNYPEYSKIEKALDNYLGRAFHENGKFDSATIYFERYQTTLLAHHPKSYAKLLHEIQERIEACKNGKEFKDHALKVFITNVGNTINGSFDDYSPVISADQKVMYYTSKRAKTSEDEPEGTLDEIYTSTQNDNGEWSKAVKVPELNSNEFHDAPVALSHDGDEMILYRSISRKNGDLYHSFLQNGKWSAPTKMPGHIDSKYWEPSACFAHDGKTLYFASDRPGGLGRSDIYVTYKDASGTWSEPANLGKTINTDHDEDSPFVLADNKTLYFSSKSHKNIGGYDVFKSVYDEATRTWSEPQNLGYPINTPDDDIYFVWSDDGTKAFFASNRHEGNYGLKDIYSMDLKLVPYDIRVFDEQGQIIPNATVELKNATTGKDLGTLTENANQDRITFYMAPKVKYAFTIKAPSFVDISDEASISNRSDFYQYYSKDYTLKSANATVASANTSPKEETPPPAVDTTAAPKPTKASSPILKDADNFKPSSILFAYNSSSLTESEKSKLKALSEWCKKHPKTTIELRGHTDNVGSASFNQTLSLSRANAARNYLSQLGIPSKNIKTKALGLSQPIGSNDTEEGKSQNRSVEILLLF